MANLIEMSEQLKAAPDQWLEQQIQNPSGMVPPYLMLSELNRRKSLRSKMAQAPTSTVAQDVVGAQPAPPGMATPDMLANQQPQPQLPQSAPAGVPSPMSGGLAASAPAKPMAPPAPQRMAIGGLVNSFVAGGPPGLTLQGQGQLDDEEEWWKRGLGMYGLSGGMMGLGPAMLAGLFARRGKKGAAPASPAPAAPAPAAMAEGGPVRMRLGGGSPFSGGYFSSMKLPYNYGTSILSGKDKDDLEIITDEFGNRVMTQGGKRLATFKPQAEFKMPEYVDTIPQTVKRPDLGEMLAEVKKVTARPEGPTALDRRIESLEGQRDKIRKPFWGDALTELGLGILSSRSPYASQAVGEAGLGALQSWRQQQARAEQQRMAIEDRLLGVESQREAQAEQNRRADLQLADTMAGREHGASVTEQQLAAQREASRQNYELKKAELAHQAAQSAISQDNTLNTVMLNQALKDPRNIDPNSPEALANRLASEKALVEHRAKMEALYRRPDTSGMSKKVMSSQELQTMARGVLNDEYFKWGVGGGDDKDTFRRRVQAGTAQNIMAGTYLAGHPWLDNPVNRALLASHVDALAYDPKKAEDKTLLSRIGTYVDEQKKTKKGEEEKEKTGIPGTRRGRYGFLYPTGPQAGAVRDYTPRFGGPQ